MKRRRPTGGDANGMPRYASTLPPMDMPRIRLPSASRATGEGVVDTGEGMGGTGGRDLSLCLRVAHVAESDRKDEFEAGALFEKTSLFSDLVLSDSTFPTSFPWSFPPWGRPDRPLALGREATGAWRRSRASSRAMRPRAAPKSTTSRKRTCRRCLCKMIICFATLPRRASLPPSV